MLGFHVGKVQAPDQSMVHDTEYWLQQINRASVVANVESGLLDRELARKIRAALDELRREAAEPGAQHCDLYIQFEPKLLKLCGMEASRLHAGRSSQDILATSNAAMNQERLMMLAGETARLCDALLETAKRESVRLFRLIRMAFRRSQHFTAITSSPRSTFSAAILSAWWNAYGVTMSVRWEAVSAMARDGR